MLLITSGAYVESELSAEFGKIPPAFLPVGNKRLYTYQIAQFGSLHERIYLTVPSDFSADEADEIYLAAHGVSLYRSPPDMTLGAAVGRFLVAFDLQGPLDILYGDTLITDALENGSDWIAVGHTDEYYNWHQEAPRNGQPGGTWTGMFSIADSAFLRVELAKDGDFIAAVTRYGEGRGGFEHKVVASWLDFGHVHTYFDSKRLITTERHFNQMEVVDGVVRKSSTDTGKIEAEADWFEQAPAAIKPFLPSYIGRRQEHPCGYMLEYLHLAALNELYVFGRLPTRVWGKIFSSCECYLRTAARLPVARPPTPEFARQIYLGKTVSRLAAYAQQSGCPLDAPWLLNGQRAPSLLSMAQEAADAVLREPMAVSFIHGDLCFSNILFDFRAGRAKMIDPRGTDLEGRPTPYGDLRYDIGKLAHSVLGLYDFIIAGFFLLEREGQTVRFRVLSERCAMLQRLFLDTPFVGRRPRQWDCYPIMVLLFLSMLPLHADNPLRQQALMANAIRLYLEWRSDDRHPDGRAEQALL